MSRPTLLKLTLALFASAGLSALVSGPSAAADCIINDPATLLNGNGGVGDCDPLTFGEGDTLVLEDTDLQVHSTDTPALAIGADGNLINGASIVNRGTIDFIGNLENLSAVEYHGNQANIFNYGSITATNAERDPSSGLAGNDGI